MKKEEGARRMMKKTKWKILWEADELNPNFELGVHCFLY